jgi:hypothetical protein
MPNIGGSMLAGGNAGGETYVARVPGRRNRNRD